MSPSEEDIVISGIGGRYPECQNVEQFQEALLKGVDLITADDRRYPKGSLGTPERLGKILDIDKFDAAYFGIHPKQANFMDPRQRILNETVYECIIDAGYNPSELRGSRTGVYVGIALFANVNEMRSMDTRGYLNIGVCLSLAANRASYCFDFKGPSYTIDAACSSSTYAFVNAVKDIKSGVTDSAIVCGTHLNLHPHETSEFNKLNMLSADGYCRVFSTLRDGYVRSEAIISVLLQKRKDSRRIYATVLGVGSNADGFKTEGITYPSSEMQFTLMKEIYTKAGINPDEVPYVEAHGTGTPAGDPQELQAIANMFCKNRKSPLPVGAVKSNMGHSETSSGLCSISKVLIAMESGIIPANLHVDPLDTELSGIKDGKLKIVTENIPWSGGIVPVNCFGFGGANSHIVLESNPKEKTRTYKRPKHRLVQVSGRTEEAVNYFLDGVEKNQDDQEFLALVDEIHKTNVEGHIYRGYTVLGDNPKREIDRYSKDRPIWFIYTGMGSQWSGLGRDLMKIEVFRNTIKRCAAALKPYNIDLEDILTNTSPTVFDDTINCFCAIGAVEIALTDVLYSLGIMPDNFAGHSLGEVGCAYADGQITPEQAMLLAFARGYATDNAKLPLGQMAAIGLTKEECQKLLPDDVFIACQNGKNSITISGLEDPVKAFVEKLSSQGVFARGVKTSGLAYHTKYIADAGPFLYDFVDKVLPNPTPRSHRWVSTSVPPHKQHESWTKYNGAEYHRNNFCSPVLFDRIFEQIPENAIIIEVAPHGLMQAILKREVSPNVTNISLMNRASDDNEQFFLSSIGKIFVAGGQPNLRKLYNDVSFPVSRGTTKLSPLVKWDHSTTWYVPYWGKTDSFGEIVKVNLSDDKYSYLEGHNIDGRVLMPATGYLELVWQVFARMIFKVAEDLPVVIENVKFKRATVLPPNEEVSFLINIMKQSGNFEIFEGGSVVVTGTIWSPKDIKTEFTNPEPPVVPQDNYLPLQKEDLYKECHLRRYMYTGLFQGIKECDPYGLQGKIEWKENFACFLDTMVHLTLVADARRDLLLPTSIEKLVIDPTEHGKQVSEEKVLPVFYNQSLATIRSGAIEIIGMETSRAPRRHQTQEDPVLEIYEFIPYETSVPDNLDLDSLLQNAVQVMLQNRRGLIKHLKICEVFVNENSVIDKVKKILSTQTMIEVEYVTYSPNNNTKSVYDTIIIKEQVVDQINIETIQKHLSEDGFVLYVGNLLKIKDTGLQIIYQAASTENEVYFLRPSGQVTKNYVVVHVKNTDFDWLNKIKELVKSKSTETVYLVNQGEETSGIVGLVQCLLSEPNDIDIKSVFIQDENAEKFSVDNEFYHEQLRKGLTFNVLRNGRWGTFAHLPLKKGENKEVADACVSILTTGDLSTLCWVESPSAYTKPHPESELVYVFYSSLNFKDVMSATGKLQIRGKEITSAEITIGFEYAGVTSRGKRVMGLTESSGLSLQVHTDLAFTWEVPEAWSLEEAATVPCVYATCYYAMIIRGQMQPGESILIHAGSGGVGLAAISIALSMGCTVFTTVGNQEKKEYLKKVFPQLKDENIGNSRNSSFKKMIMQNTNRRGVDIVLNSLSGQLFQESLKCIAVRGRFLEIGKVDFFNGTPIDSKIFLRDCSFHGILLDDLFGTNSKVKYDINRLLREGIRKGVVKPLATTIFDETEVENAFRYLSSGKHKGKVLVRIRKEDPVIIKSPLRTINAIPKIYFDPKKSYILIGGLGGFGLELTDWMIRRGATKIILNARRNVSNGYQSYCLKKWASCKGVTVKVNNDDSTTIEGATTLVLEAERLGPVGGVYNMAFFVKDALVENQTKELYEAVFKPKIVSGQNMDTVTRKHCPQLDHFVVFSSVACGRGNPGQSNYGMANSALERLCEKRKRENLPGVAVQWGPVGDVGALGKAGVQDKVFEYMIPQSIYSCIDALEKFMLQSATAVGSSLVLANKSQTQSVGSSKTPSIAVAHILGIKNIDLIDKTSTLSQLGLDSLMGAEIKQTLYRNYQLELSIDEIRDLTFNNLIEMGSTNENAQPTTLTNGIHEDSPENDSNAIISKEAVVELNHSKDSKRIVFLIHPIEGRVGILKMIANQLKANVYGLQCTEDADYENLHDYASYFIKHIKSKQPIGPYVLCGYSYGGALAFEMGLQLENNGEDVAIVSIDSSPAYVKNILQDLFTRHEKSVNKSQAGILKNFSLTFTDLVVKDQVMERLENEESWEKQLQIISDLISKETGLEATELAVSADRFFKRCKAGYFYEPKSILKGKLLLIRREDNVYLSPEDYDLQKICKQKVEILKLKGDHRTILFGENSRRISDKINEMLIQ